MGELTEQEKLERRRLKRQQRILQSGESRLSKITGTAFPNRFTPSPSPSPSTSTAAIKSPSEPKPTTSSPSPINTVRQRRPSDDPSDELGAPPTLNSAHGTNNDSSQPMAPNNAMFGEGLFGNGEGSSDPMQQLFAAAMNNANGAGGAGFNPLAALLANQNMDGSSSSRAGETAANAEAQRMMDKSAKYWNLLHFIMMVGLGVYAVFTEWKRAGSDRFASLVSNDASMTNYPAIHVPLFWYFVTLELCMQSARLFYQQGKIPTSSNTWLQLATQLPHPFGQIVTIVLRYRLIWSCLVQDICILIFIIGISQVVSSALLSL